MPKTTFPHWKDGWANVHRRFPKAKLIKSPDLFRYESILLIPKLTLGSMYNMFHSDIYIPVPRGFPGWFDTNEETGSKIFEVFTNSGLRYFYNGPIYCSNIPYKPAFAPRELLPLKGFLRNWSFDKDTLYNLTMLIVNTLRKNRP